MAKQLLLIRHAKSDWNNLLLSDFERPLNERGLKNAPEMANRLLEKQLIPQHLISSPALRALTTTKIFATELKIEHSEIILREEMYHASTLTLLELVNSIDDKYDFVAIFGHNSGLSDFANYLCDEVAYNLPTCGIVLLKFPFEQWKMLSKNTGEFLFYDYPKNRTFYTNL
jgi:phosphohistidine phosphatase